MILFPQAILQRKLEIQQTVGKYGYVIPGKAAAKQADMYQLISQRTKEALGFETEKSLFAVTTYIWDPESTKDAYVTSRHLENAKDYFDGGLI